MKQTLAGEAEGVLREIKGLSQKAFLPIIGPKKAILAETGHEKI